MFNDHVIWVQDPQEEVYLIMGHLVCSVPTFISRPKSEKSGLNLDQNSKKTRPNLDPI